MSDLNKSLGKANKFVIKKRHVFQISELIDGKPYFPELIEIFPSNLCNHKCTFCISADLNSSNAFLDPKIFYSIIKDISKAGNSKVRICGGGEPLLHPNISDFIKFSANKVNSVSLITNGVLMKNEILESIVKYCHEVRISVDAGNSGVYARMHGTSNEMFNKTIDNIISLIERRGKASTPSIEVSFVATKENINSLNQLIKIVNRVKLDVLSITTNTLNSIEDQLLIYEEVQVIVNQNIDSIVKINSHVSYPDTFEKTSRLCPAFLLYGVVTSEGRYFSSCHHVGKNIKSLGIVSDSVTLKELLSKPEVIEKQLKYAFGNDIKTNKLCKHPYNKKLLELIINSKNTVDRITTWMSQNLDYKFD